MLKEGLRQLERAWSDRTRGNNLTVSEGKARWDIGKKSFSVRMVRSQYRMPREPVAALSLVQG